MLPLISKQHGFSCFWYGVLKAKVFCVFFSLFINSSRRNKPPPPTPMEKKEDESKEGAVSKYAHTTVVVLSKGLPQILNKIRIFFLGGQF